MNPRGQLLAGRIEDGHGKTEEGCSTGLRDGPLSRSCSVALLLPPRGLAFPLLYPTKAAAPRRRMPQTTLCATANHNAIAFTFRSPRTASRTKPRLRACALTHSAVAAR